MSEGLLTGFLASLVAAGVMAAAVAFLFRQRHTEEVLRDSQIWQQALLDNIPDMAWLKDKDGRFIAVNEPFALVCGRRPGDIMGRTDFDVWPRELAQAYAGDDREIRQSGKPKRVDELMKMSGGEMFWAETIKQPIFDDRGKVVGTTGIARDITERRRALDELKASENRYYELFNNINSGVAVYEARPDGEDFVFKDANRAAENIEKISKNELVGKSVQEIFPAIGESGLLGVMRKVSLGGNSEHKPPAYYSDQRISGWREHYVYRLPSGEVVVVFDDVTEKMETLEKLRLDAKVFESSAEGIVITDNQGTILAVNRAFTAITGFRQEELQGKTPDEAFFGWKEPGFFRSVAEALAVEGQWMGEISNRRKNGEAFPCWLHITLVRDAQGKITNTISMLNDVSGRKEADELVRRLSQFDMPTGLPNRQLLEDRLEQSIAQVAHYHGRLALLFVNLDRFSIVNETLGFTAGDQVLQVMARRLIGMVGSEAVVARLSADNFVAVVSREEEVSGLSAKVHQLLQTLAEPMTIGGHEIRLTASMGISLYPDDGSDGDTLMRNASIALNRARDDGRGSCRFYKPEMNIKAMEAMALGNGLWHALEREELELFYQPQIDLNSGEIIGMEALPCWRHPERGLILPDEFLPLAEEIGVAEPIAEWMLHQVCRQGKTWHDEGFPFLRMAANISAFGFRSKNVLEIVAQALEENGLPASFLELEVSESFIIKFSAGAGDVLPQLKRMGVRLVIDRFGSGYSSLNHLRVVTIDKLKIDRSFIRDITRNQNDAAVVQAVIALGHSLKLDIIAEGVETEGQFHYLRAIHCDEMQGGYFSLPLPADEALKLLQSKRRAVADGADWQRRTLLLVDDEENILIALKRHLRRDGYHILTAVNAREGLDLLASHDVGVILSDQRMQDMRGTEFLSQVKTMYPGTVRMILSGYTDVGTIAEAINTGEVYRFLTKPWKEHELREVVKDAFERYELARVTKESEQLADVCEEAR